MCAKSPCNASFAKSPKIAIVSLCEVIAVGLLAGCASGVTSTERTGIPVGSGPNAIAISPDGTTAYVVNNINDTVSPINLSTKTSGTPIKVGFNPGDIAISPDGAVAYVL